MKQYKHIVDQVLEDEGRLIWLFWLSTLVAYPIYSFSYQPMGESFIHKLAFLPVQIIAAYLLLKFQLPKLLYRRRYIGFILSLIASAFILAILMNLIDTYGTHPFLYKAKLPENLGELWTIINESWMWYFIWIYFSPMVLIGILFIKRSYEEKQTLQQLIREKANAELNFFKAQMHPEFLSNTLKNLEQLAEQQSDQAPVVVEKLADMLDYMLYQTQAERVNLDQEISLLNNYLYLEGLRFGTSKEWTLEQSIDDERVKIAPLLLFSMVEEILPKRAEQSDTGADLKVELKLNKKQLDFSASFCQSEERPQISTTSHSLLRQLELSYPEDYQLEHYWKDRCHTLQANITL